MIDDPLVGSVDCPETALAPDESETCTATYSLTQADVDGGHVSNAASAIGTPPTGDDVTASDDTDTVIPASPAISLEKQAGDPSGNPADIRAGSTIEYTFAVANTGNVTLDPVTISDPMVGDVTCPVTSLAPGASEVCNATYSLTQADVDAGFVHNAATATGTAPSGAPVSADAFADSTIPSAPAIALDKQAGIPSGNPGNVGAGSTIDYTFVISNSGNVTLDPVGLSDASIGAVLCPESVLTPGDSISCTATYTLTQVNVDAGHFANSATVTGTPPTGDPVSTTDETDTPIASAGGLVLDKQAGTPSGDRAGDTVPYSFEVLNSGNVTLDPVTVEDPLAGPVACLESALAPGASTSCTATYTLSQADVDAGTVHNEATATGTQPDGVEVSATDATDITIAADPVITFDKQAATPSGNSAGDTIDFDFLVSNAGNVTLDPVLIDDALVESLSCPQTALPPAGGMTCTATRTLTQLDVDSGHFANVATVTATTPSGGNVSATDATDTPITSAPAILLEKTAGAPSGNFAGDTIEYTFKVSNLGNLTLAPVTVVDPKVGAVSCPTTVLAPVESMTCDATYTLDQDDVDLGTVHNDATATGVSPTGGSVSSSDETDTPIDALPALTLDKSAGTPSGDPQNSRAGDTIDYTFLVTNTGNVTLDPVTLSDPTVGSVTCPVSVLAPGADTTCTATYTLTQDDIDAGGVHNDATATGASPAGIEATATDSTDTPLLAAPAVALDKQAGVPTGDSAGSTIDYVFLVTNTGNVTLDPISVTDPLVGNVDCPISALPPDGTTTCTATYSLTQADVDSGHVENTAVVTGTPPTGPDVTATDTTDTAITGVPLLTLAKTAGTPSGASAGDTVPYSFVVTNTGNLTLEPVTLEDPLVGSLTCDVTSLAPTDVMTCSATYTLTQTDVDAGQVVNTANASGTTPTGDVVTAQDTVSTPVTPAPALLLDKQAGTPSGDNAGDTIDFAFVVTNSGNVTLDPVSVVDPTVGTVVCPDAVLAPAETTTCSASYTLTQGDVDAGHLANSATATGTPPTGAAVSATDTTDTAIAATPAITLDKTAGTPSGDPADTRAGDTIEYTFVVTNTGNVTLDPVRVDDPKAGAVTCPDTVLAPTASMTCSATYTLDQGDVDSGHVANAATALGTPPSGADVSADDETDTPIAANPGIALDKQAGDPSGLPNAPRAGDTIDYAFVVTNTGNVTLSTLTIDDPTVGSVACPSDTLAPDASITCTATYELVQDDVDAGQVINDAVASGNPPTGATVTAEDSTTTVLTSAPAIALEKGLAGLSGVDAGAVIDYTFLVTNTGNVTLDGVGVVDSLIAANAGAVSCPAAILAPGEHTICAAAYTVTQDDVDAGEVLNSATATGTSPGGADVTAEDSITTSLEATPLISLVKSADTAGPVATGDPINYTFEVRNAGNVSLNRVRVEDPMLATVTCPVASLAPAETATCTSPPYTVTAANVAAGRIVNRATAFGDGRGPGGDTEVRAVADVVVRTSGPASPGIRLDKDVADPGPYAGGDSVHYTFKVTNTGQVTLNRVDVSDPMVGNVTCLDRVLTPGDTTKCTAPPYVVTTQDVRNGFVVNTASATGDYDPGPGRVAARASVVADSDTVKVRTTKLGTLPFTGTPVPRGLPLAALTMLVAGFALIIAGRRRRKIRGQDS